MQEKSNQFLSSEDPCELKDLPQILAESKNHGARKTCAYDYTGGHSIRGLSERSVSFGGILCFLWLAIFKSI